MKFSNKIMQVRDACGWSQDALGKVLGVKLGTVGRWERGEKLPTDERLARFNSLLDEILRRRRSGEEPDRIIAALSEEKSPMAKADDLYQEALKMSPQARALMRLALDQADYQAAQTAPPPAGPIVKRAAS